MEVKNEWLQWMASQDTGISSETMFSAITGVPVAMRDIPHDMADVGRCVRMLRRLPDLRPQIEKVILQHKEWMPFIDCWKELERLYDECVAFERLPAEEKAKMKKRKHFVSPNTKAWDLMQQLETASYYLRGMRMQNSSSSWSNRPPKDY
jgi:hypothetical protein